MLGERPNPHAMQGRQWNQEHSILHQRVVCNGRHLPAHFDSWTLLSTDVTYSQDLKYS